jgi:aerobic carbon-monoxide dehydrogenase large subunit
MSILGARVTRLEDARLLTQGGTYVDDLRVPELHGAFLVTFVRSTHAHARITGIDAAAARRAPGVVAVLTARDIDDLPLRRHGGRLAEPLLATDRVRYVGEPVAIVITEGCYQGADAASLVSVDYEPLRAVVGPAAAIADESLLFPTAGTNVALNFRAAEFDDSAFDACDVVVEQELVNQRVAPLPMEARAAAARWADGRLTVWASSQSAHASRLVLAKKLGLPLDAIHVIVPDVGGGFGAKIGIDRDGIAVAWAAKRTGFPLRWAESRTENLVGMTHGRAQLQTIKIGGMRDGRVLAYRLDIVQDVGAYLRSTGSLPRTTCQMAAGVYDIPEVQTAFRLVVTNATPVAAYRGAGRPEATAAIERAIDLFASEIGMDPAEVRRCNLIPPDRFPFAAKTGVLYDTGRYAEALDKALAAADYRELRAEQERRRAREDSRQLGVGLSTYVEITAGDAQTGETARVEIHADGSATVSTGSSAQGQGHHTAWAMLVHAQLGVPMNRIACLHGDTDTVPEGVGTYGSRSLQLGGSAVHQAAVRIREKACRLAADLLGVRDTDVILNIQEGTWHVRGNPETALNWARVAEYADGLTEYVNFTNGWPTFPFGAHVAVVEVDTETGQVRLARHVAVDDAGPVLNRLLAEGQRHGGIAQGAAQALLEEVCYDSDGNPLSSTLLDYAAITATDLPSFELVASETPTPRNPLGVKGIGEAGTIGAAPAVQNAAINALAYLGVRHIDMPLTPQRVWAAIEDARSHRRPSRL